VIIPWNISYKRGVLKDPGGNVVLEFDTRINPVLDELFQNLGQLVGLEVDISGLPDSFVLDGTTYNVNYLEDIQQEVLDLIDAWETELGFTAVKTRRVVRPLLRLLKKMVQEGWF
jgi:hypothetical protein